MLRTPCRGCSSRRSDGQARHRSRLPGRRRFRSRADQQEIRDFRTVLMMPAANEPSQMPSRAGRPRISTAARPTPAAGKMGDILPGSDVVKWLGRRQRRMRRRPAGWRRAALRRPHGRRASRSQSRSSSRILDALRRRRGCFARCRMATRIAIFALDANPPGRESPPLSCRPRRWANLRCFGSRSQDSSGGGPGRGLTNPAGTPQIAGPVRRDTVGFGGGTPWARLSGGPR